MRAATQDAWIAGEPRFSTALQDLLARATRKPLRTLALAAVATALMIAARVSREPAYVATLTFRMAEGDVQDPRNAPRPPARIREHISNVALNRQQILDLMEKHGVSARLRAVNPTAAVESMREDIEIDVVRNYFLFDRESAAEPRSAQVVLSFTGDDRDQVQAVVHDIGTIVLENQATARNTRLSQAKEVHAARARDARDHLRLLQEQRARLLRREAAGGSEDAARARAELAALQQEIQLAFTRIRNIEKRAAELQFAHEAEQQRLGLSFERVDESVRALREPLTGVKLVGYGAFVFSIVSPVLALVLGAFNQRIYRATDVTSSGFPILGTVPPFPGQDARAYRARRGRAR